MSWAAIRSALAARIAAVNGVGKVHEYVRNPAGKGWNDEEFRELFLVESSPGVYFPNSWMITRTGVPRTPCVQSDNAHIETHRVTIRANYGQVDSEASEHTFNDLLDDVARDLAFGDRSLGGTAFTHDLPQTSDIGRAMFYTNKFLTHDATITLNIDEVVNGQ